MAWNRPTAEVEVKRKSEKGRSAAGRLFLLGAVVVLGAAVAWWLFSSDGHEVTHPAERPKRIVEVKPARRSVQDAKDQAPSALHPKIKVGKTEFEMKIVPHKEGRVFMHQVYTNTNRSADNRVTSSAVEQVLLQIFSRELGDMPMPLPGVMPPEEMKHLTEILISKNKVSEKDEAEVAASKEILQLAKEAMKEHIRNGGDPEGFLDYYHAELMKAFETRKEAELMVNKMVGDGEDDELVVQFTEKVNEVFRKEGIKELSLPQHLQNDDTEGK